MKIDKKRHGSGHLKITSSTMLSFTVTGTYITISHRAPLAWILFKLTSLLQVYLGSHGCYGEDGEQVKADRAVGREDYGRPQCPTPGNWCLKKNFKKPIFPWDQ